MNVILLCGFRWSHEQHLVGTKMHSAHIHGPWYLTYERIFNISAKEELEEVTWRETCSWSRRPVVAKYRMIYFDLGTVCGEIIFFTAVIARILYTHKLVEKPYIPTIFKKFYKTKKKKEKCVRSIFSPTHNIYIFMSRSLSFCRTIDEDPG